MDNEKLHLMGDRLGPRNAEGPLLVPDLMVLKEIGTRSMEIQCGKIYLDGQPYAGHYRGSYNLLKLFGKGLIGSRRNKVLLTDAGKKALSSLAMEEARQHQRRKAGPVPWWHQWLLKNSLAYLITSTGVEVFQKELNL